MNSSSEDVLEPLLHQAASGDSAALQAFFEAFLTSTLHIPERTGAVELSAGVSYPDPFLNVLAVAVNDQPYVPVFSSPQMIVPWCGRELPCRRLTGQAICSLIPETWWLCINPGQGLEKELSPWEVARLRSGDPSAIAEVVAENRAGCADDNDLPIATEVVGDTEFVELKAELTAAAQNEALIEAMYLLRDLSTPTTDESQTNLVVGFVCGRGARGIEDVLAAVRLRTIGENIAIRPLVAISGDKNSLVGALLRRHLPFYRRQRPTSWRRFLFRDTT